VDDPPKFLGDIRDSLAPRDNAFISTPNTADALLEALPEDYVRFYFRKAHLWYFDRDSLRKTAGLAGFTSVNVMPHQRFGMGNFLRWLSARAWGQRFL
jgi:hypothetical protein